MKVGRKPTTLTQHRTQAGLFQGNGSVLCVKGMSQPGGHRARGCGEALGGDLGTVRLLSVSEHLEDMLVDIGKHLGKNAGHPYRTEQGMRQGLLPENVQSCPRKGTYVCREHMCTGNI